MEKSRLVCRRFVGFIAECGHWQAITLLKHCRWTFLRSHLILHTDLILCLSVVHDECLLAHWCLLECHLSLLIHIVVVPYRPRLYIGTESWVQVLDP